MRRRMAILLAAMATTVALPQVAVAEETVCRGTIGAKTLDNVKVPQGESCTLRGTKVKGTIKVVPAWLHGPSFRSTRPQRQAQDRFEVISKTRAHLLG
jgi:hypothetical protein